MKSKKAMTYSELKTALAAMSEEQLALSVHWFGDEIGGEVTSVHITTEKLFNVGDGLEPVSNFDAGYLEENPDEIMAVIEPGTPILMTDEVESEEGG